MFDTILVIFKNRIACFFLFDMNKNSYASIVYVIYNDFNYSVKRKRNSYKCHTHLKSRNQCVSKHFINKNKTNYLS